MNETLLILLAERIKAYKAVAKKAGVKADYLGGLGPKNPGPQETKAIIENTGDLATIRIQGPMDALFGFDVRNLIDQLDEAKPKNVNMLIESPGGHLADGLALYSDLRARVRDGVNLRAEARGIVASAAVFPFLAADERTMSTGSQLMIHKPWSMLLLAGTADEIENDASKRIKSLRSAEKTLRTIYDERTKNPPKQIDAWLEDETWFTPEEAEKHNFSTGTIENSADKPSPELLEQARSQLAMCRLRCTEGR